MLHQLSNRRISVPKKAAALMVAIQEAHPEFVPVLDCDDLKSTFYKDCFREAATVSGLKICALWNESSASFVAELLEQPKCSICTLDFSKLTTQSWTTTSCWNESAFAKNSSVKTWQWCSAGWPGLKFIGRHVHELKLRILNADVFTEGDMQQLQAILEQGNIDGVSLEARTSKEHLLLAQAVQHANRNGGRVHEVHLLARRYLRGQIDNFSAPQILEILCGSRSVISVTLPDAWWAESRNLGRTEGLAQEELGRVSRLCHSAGADGPRRRSFGHDRARYALPGAQPPARCRPHHVDRHRIQRASVPWRWDR